MRIYQVRFERVSASYFVVANGIVEAAAEVNQFAEERDLFVIGISLCGDLLNQPEDMEEVRL